MHDLFEWWAYIWIPALLGAATLLVSVVALMVSRNATKIAHEVEVQREKAAEERAADARRERLQSMAVDEARALHRYAVERQRTRPRFRAVGVNAPPEPRSPVEEALVDAQVVLEQSLVPGAQQIFTLTRFDLDHRSNNLPKSLTPESDGYEARRELRHAILSNRDRRMFDRIRRWGLDPEDALPAIIEDFEMMQNDPDNYLATGPKPNVL